jgi:lipid A 4'-phosphatase
MLGLSRAFLVVFVVGSLVLVFVPQLDMVCARLFYDSQDGSFVWRDSAVAMVVYHAVTWASRVLPALLIVGFCVSFFARKRLLGLDARAFLYLLLVFALGVGLLVNTLFKQHWGRARPHQIEAFGGELEFTPAYVISRQHETHGSWPSGHASFGFYFVAVGMLLKGRRTLAIVLASVSGAFFGLLRMGQGKHFLSDVVSAFFILYIVARVLYWLLYETKLGARWEAVSSS